MHTHILLTPLSRTRICHSASVWLRCQPAVFVLHTLYTAYFVPSLEKLLLQAWQEESLDTLKLIAHMRDIRDGKGEKKQFYTCAKWLAKHHPLTLAGNLSQIIDVSHCSIYRYVYLDHMDLACSRSTRQQPA